MVLHGLSRTVTVCSYLGHFQQVQSISCSYKNNFSENIIKYNRKAKAQQTNFLAFSCSKIISVASNSH